MFFLWFSPPFRSFFLQMCCSFLLFTNLQKIKSVFQFYGWDYLIHRIEMRIDLFSCVSVVYIKIDGDFHWIESFHIQIFAFINSFSFTSIWLRDRPLKITSKQYYISNLQDSLHAGSETFLQYLFEWCDMLKKYFFLLKMMH